MTQHTILWRRLDQPGHESARLWFQSLSWHLAGTAVFVHRQQPCLFNYHLTCDSHWHTQSARVTGWVGDTTVQFELAVGAAQQWRLNGEEIPSVTGCIDLDLNFSPSTNLLPIRRLALDVGQSVAVKAAWLRFPSFKLEPLDQVYRRTSETTYRYESAGGEFVRDLEVNTAGFVTHYPDFWVREAEL